MRTLLATCLALAFLIPSKRALADVEFLPCTTGAPNGLFIPVTNTEEMHIAEYRDARRIIRETTCEWSEGLVGYERGRIWIGPRIRVEDFIVSIVIFARRPDF